MSKPIIVAALVMLAAASPVLAQAEAPDSEAAKIVADCSVRKFETSVEIEQAGEKRQTKMKLCAARNADDAAWIKTLEDAKAKIAAHPDISKDSKSKIAAEIDREIARTRPIVGAKNLLPEAPIAASPPKPEYGSAPSLPALKPVAPKPAWTDPVRAEVKPLAPLANALPPVTRPRLTIRCLDSGQAGAGSDCFALARSTRLAIRADENLDGNTGLRFLRKGDIRGEIKLAGMRQGQLIRSPLPPELCRDVVSSQVEIQVMRSNRVTDSMGPYKLRC